MEGRAWQKQDQLHGMQVGRVRVMVSLPAFALESREMADAKRGVTGPA